MKLILFDIDGTLIHSGGAGKNAMEAAFAELYGTQNGLNGVLLSGSTDTVILKESLANHGRSWSETTEKEFKARYFAHLRDELKKSNDRRAILPGFPDLLQALQQQTGVHLGLLTGNWRQGAELKLGSFDLWHYFELGAFSDDHADRNKLLPFAVRRAQDLWNFLPVSRNVYVIGDTPKDIQCARPHGATAVGVATGGYSMAVLQRERPDFLFEDLSNLQEVLSIFQ